LHAQQWFITNYEYGKMLYNDPRGISCARCHGLHAKGKIIATYRHKGKLIKIITPDIRHISFENLKKFLLKHKHSSIMPKYSYLTDSEIKALYLYIHAQLPKKTTKVKHDIPKHIGLTKNSRKK
jgi:mono/diheme cytochrome c family protein